MTSVACRFLSRLTTLHPTRFPAKPAQFPTAVASPLSPARAYRASGNRAPYPMATAQPEWHAPPAPPASVQERLPKLSVYNSLTRSKTPFVPLDPEGRRVGWYACGPTVYDDAVCRLCVLMCGAFSDSSCSAMRWLRWQERPSAGEDGRLI